MNLLRAENETLNASNKARTNLNVLTSTSAFYVSISIARLFLLKHVHLLGTEPPDEHLQLMQEPFRAEFQVA